LLYPRKVTNPSFRLFSTNVVLQLSNLTSTSAVHPGALVRGLITASSSSGINMQVLGLFSGTVHPLHISEDLSKFQVGKKIQARILWDVLGPEPRQFALSTLDHIIKLQARDLQPQEVDVEDGTKDQGDNVEQTYPVGTILDNVKVSRVDTDRGLFLDIRPGLQGVVHVSNTLSILLACHSTFT